jgi:hypothetical protein
MPTDNKKISAYVPDAVYDRFIQYKDERNISMSQAAIEIFADYFGINLNPTISNESTGELLSRVDILEKELAGLKNHFVLLSERVDLMQSTSELSVIKPVEVPVHKNIDSELDNSLQIELLKEDITEQLMDTNIINESNSSPLNKLPQEHIVEPEIDTNIVYESESSLDSEPLNDSEIIDKPSLLGKPKDELPLQLVLEPTEIISDLSGSVDELFHTLPIDTKFGALKISALAKRFNLSGTMINKITKYDINKQISYTALKDPDKRPWVYLESAKLFYPLKISE